jgi:hypothetical protein
VEDEGNLQLSFAISGASPGSETPSLLVLHVSAPWRLEAPTRVIAGSGDTIVIRLGDRTQVRPGDIPVVDPDDWSANRKDTEWVGHLASVAGIEEQRRFKAIVGKRVVEVNIILPSYTLRLDFDGGLCFWAFPATARELYGDSEAVDASWWIEDT